MNTTAEKGAYLNQTKSLLKDKINALGGSIDDETTFREYVDQLDNVYDVLPKTEFQEGTEVTIEGGLKGKLDFDDGKVGFGQSSQDSTQGYNLSNFNTDSQNGISYNINTIKIVNPTSFNYADNWNLKNDSSLSGSTYSIYMCVNGTKASGVTIELNIGKTGNGYAFQKLLSSNTTNFNNDISVGTITLGANEVFTSFNTYLSQSVTANLEVKVMVVKGSYTTSTIPNFEPYTNGASPSPNWEQPIQCVTGNQEIVESGKNLFEPVISIDGTQIVGNNMPNLGVTDGEFSFTANGADAYFGQVSASGSTYTANRGIKIYRNGNEKISYKISNTEINRNFITAYDSNGTSLGYVEKSGSSQGTYVFPTNCDFVTFRIGKGNAVSGTIYKFNVMVAYGDTIPDYEPYHTPITYPISLGNNKFYSIGDYADELLYDVDDDKVYKKEVIGEYNFTGNETIGKSGSNYFTISKSNYLSNFNLESGTADYLLNKYSATTSSSLSIGQTRVGSTNMIFNYNGTNTTETEALFKISLQTTILYAPLNTATYIELTDTTLKQQVKNWYYSQSFNGTTIIESNGDLPMIIKVRALKGA